MMTPHPTDNDLRNALEARVDAFCRTTGMSRSNIGVHALNDATAIRRILEPHSDFRISTYQRLMDWIERNADAGTAANGNGPADAEEFEVLDSACGSRVRNVTASLSYDQARAGRPRETAKQGRWSAGQPRLVVGLPAVAIAGWPFPAEQQFAFARGVAKVRIVLTDAGGVPLTRSRSGGGTFFFGHVPALGNEPAPKEWLPFRRLDPMQAGGAVIEIDSPAWLRAAS